jgi:hypothetical protein
LLARNFRFYLIFKPAFHLSPLPFSLERLQSLFPKETLVIQSIHSPDAVLLMIERIEPHGSENPENSLTLYKKTSGRRKMKNAADKRNSF